MVKRSARKFKKKVKFLWERVNNRRDFMQSRLSAQGSEIMRLNLFARMARMLIITLMIISDLFSHESFFTLTLLRSRVPTSGSYWMRARIAFQIQRLYHG